MKADHVVVADPKDTITGSRDDEVAAEYSGRNVHGHGARREFSAEGAQTLSMPVTLVQQAFDSMVQVTNWENSQEIKQETAYYQPCHCSSHCC